MKNTASSIDRADLTIDAFVFSWGYRKCVICGNLSMSIAIGLTSLYGFPGTMILSQEAAKSINSTPEEFALIEGKILPKMVIAGISTVTITSVFITGIFINQRSLLTQRFLYRFLPTHSLLFCNDSE